MEAKNCDHATRLRVRNWFFSSLLGQVIHAQIDVREDHLLIEVDLPWLLQRLAQPVERFLTRAGADTLKLEKS